MESKRRLGTGKAKMMMERTASRTVKFTFTLLKIIFLIIIVYTVIISIYILFTPDAQEFLIDIVTLSIGGFWAFFLGYFGWRMGQNLEDYLAHMKKKK
jgi:hypothetical protein